MIKVGDIIKSLDFPHTTEHYMIGRVDLIDTERGYIHCTTIKQVSGGKESPLEDFNNKFSTVPLGDHWMKVMFVAPRLTVLG